MDKKPVLLVLLLALAIVVAYVGFIANVPAVEQPAAVGQVQLEVVGEPSQISAGTGMVSLVVV